MKKIGILFAILFSSFTLTAQESAATVTVTIENVLNTNGTILASLHTSDTFMNGAGVADLSEAAQKGSVTFTFENVAPGTYAIMVLHDENDNKRMDFEANGMPKESYGMSGNEMAMGPPTFADAKFEVMEEDTELIIRF